ncbi:hypothetical protein B0H11DRAFT_2214629 [Mycena galericulata]|nr:hypothetical protein B0H11DRAFT_2214629 [Mycena galericulata]
MATDTELTASARVYSDEEFAALIANLGLSEPPPRPPRTPPPPPVSNQIITHTPPPEYASDAVAPTTPGSTPLYYYESPTSSGYTSSWAVAGSETQGVPGARVVAIQKREKKKSGPKKKAYVVFLGRQLGVFRTWSQVEPLISGVSNAIYRGYRTTSAAEAAYEYAHSRSLTRVCGNSPSSSSQQPLAIVPTPTPYDGPNPLLSDEDILDDTWYVVYRGVVPGVYHSLIEALLNTVGLPGCLYESVVGRAAAFALFDAAQIGGRTGTAQPPSYNSRR